MHCFVRGGWTAGAISLKLKVSFAKSRLLARSRPSVCPIGRPRLARATWPRWLALLLASNRNEEICRFIHPYHEFNSSGHEMFQIQQTL
jgi:hypothetical protein